jgi:hypothetical protein
MDFGQMFRKQANRGRSLGRLRGSLERRRARQRERSSGHIHIYFSL